MEGKENHTATSLVQHARQTGVGKDTQSDMDDLGIWRLSGRISRMGFYEPSARSN